ncbi:hypothetical protein SAMN04488540_12061 [Ferrimonas sediminum]|uniref:DUF2946 domain-containing protein n=1 Tax=Ferrimonas sediminum TaxID=718193 RepID=A0A1G8ZN33_9GAMM|nr:hypothetical protein [Ferrimonas sediminum]SDK16532.1 hypothetical protein SAMN04488540_12061 [Ferrimonas sediminum]
MSRLAVVLMAFLSLALMIQGSVAQIHLAPKAEVVMHHGAAIGEHAPSQSPCCPQAQPSCHDHTHPCQGECGQCQILVAPSGIMGSMMSALLIAVGGTPVHFPAHFASVVQEQALRPPIG